jgi:transcriptional regulator with XRE-family HTH domain
MATAFGEWVRKQRGAMSQAQLAREITRYLGADFTRDRVWDLENGTPKNPSADLVIAIASALGRPLTEALASLGYQLEPNDASHVHPAMLGALRHLSLSEQEALAALLPHLMELSRQLSPRTPPLRRVAEPDEPYH